MIPLTPEQLTARRLERADIETQLRTLRARHATLTREILTGSVVLPKGVRPEQLTLEDRADLEAAASEAVEHNRREDVRGAILAALEGGVELTVAGLRREVTMAFARVGRAAASETEVSELVAVLTSARVVVGQERGEEAWYRLAPRAGVEKAGKGQKKGKEKSAAPKPLEPPAVPKDVHPQVALRSWLWSRLEQTAGLTLDQLASELKAFDREDIEDTLNLLYSCNLVGDRNDKGGLVWWASDTGVGGTVDRVVLDAALAAVRDAGEASDADVGTVLGVTEGLAACLLDELEAAGRVEPAKRGSLGTPETWQVAKKKGKSAQDRTGALIPGVEPAPARGEVSL